MEPFVNVAGYRFVDLPDRDELRQPFRDVCEKNRLLGTILLSTEGINFFLCGDTAGFTLASSSAAAEWYKRQKIRILKVIAELLLLNGLYEKTSR